MLCVDNPALIVPQSISMHEPSRNRELRPDPVWPELADPHDEGGEDQHKDPLAVEFGRRGGLKGGRARADKLTADERSDIARKAAGARWGDRAKTAVAARTTSSPSPRKPCGWP